MSVDTLSERHAKAEDAKQFVEDAIERDAPLDADKLLKIMRALTAYIAILNNGGCD